MTEKRFTRIVCSNDEYTGSLYLNDEPLKIDDVCKLLNEQHETIQQLKKEIEDLNWELTEIKKSEDENYEIMDGL